MPRTDANRDPDKSPKIHIMSRTDANRHPEKAPIANSPTYYLLFQMQGMGLVPSLLRFYLCFFSTLYAELLSDDFLLLRSPHWKRVGVLCCLLLFLPLLMVINHVGFVLDDLLYPQWRKQAIHKPMFIVGNPRSGTTWLHRLMAQEQNLFTSFRTWELLIGVSVTWHKFIIDMYCFDQCFFAGLGEKLLLGLEVFTSSQYTYPLRVSTPFYKHTIPHTIHPSLFTHQWLPITPSSYPYSHSLCSY